MCSSDLKYLEAGKKMAGKFPHNTAYYAKQKLTSQSGFNPENEYAKEILYADIKEDRNILICSHNPVLPLMLARLLKHSKIEPEIKHLKPGQAWVLEFNGKKCVGISHLIAPVSAHSNQEI